MIIWISGPYGVGKSTLAEALADKIEHVLIFDAEGVGNAVRENYPNMPYGAIFEDYPLWCDFNYALLKDVHEKFQRNIIVPMTLVRQNSYDKIIHRLITEGIDTKLIILEATYKNIHDRILSRGEDENCWCMQNIEMARAGSAAVTGGHHIATDGKSVAELTGEVLSYLHQTSP